MLLHFAAFPSQPPCEVGYYVCFRGVIAKNVFEKCGVWRVGCRSQHMQPVLTPLQWSIEDITVSSHRGLRTIKTCVSEWRGQLGRSSWFCRLFNYFRRNIIPQKDFVILLPGRGGMVQSVETLHRSHCLHLCIPLCLCERNIFHKCRLSCITTHISTWMTVLTQG